MKPHGTRLIAVSLPFPTSFLSLEAVPHDTKNCLRREDAAKIHISSQIKQKKMKKF